MPHLALLTSSWDVGDVGDVVMAMVMLVGLCELERQKRSWGKTDALWE
jgi:hypothetical protein